MRKNKHERKVQSECEYPISNILFLTPDLSMVDSYFEKYEFLKMYNITFVTPEWITAKKIIKTKSKKKNTYEKVYYHPELRDVARKIASSIGIRDVIPAAL